MNCRATQENLSAYLHGELTIDEMQQMHRHLATCNDCVQEELDLHKTQQVLSQYHDIPLPIDFDVQLTKKINRIQNKKSIRWTQIISSAAAAILLTLGIQYLIATAETRSLPDHYSLFQKSQEVAQQESAWADRMIDKFMIRSAKIINQK
jgi:anti-sigma factor RsiW